MDEQEKIMIECALSRTEPEGVIQAIDLWNAGGNASVLYVLLLVRNRSSKARGEY